MPSIKSDFEILTLHLRPRFHMGEMTQGMTADWYTCPSISYTEQLELLQFIAGYIREGRTPPMVLIVLLLGRRHIYSQLRETGGNFETLMYAKQAVLKAVATYE